MYTGSVSSVFPTAGQSKSTKGPSWKLLPAYLGRSELDFGAGDKEPALIHSSQPSIMLLLLEVTSEKNPKPARGMGEITLKRRGRENL